MFDVNVVDFLTQNMVDPVFNTMREYAANSWTDYTKNASLLAATGIIAYPVAVAVAAAAHDVPLPALLDAYLVAFAGKAGDTAAYLTKVLYVVGVLAGALGVLEAVLKIVFGRDAGAFAFATVVGTVIGSLIPFIARRR